MNEQKTIKDYTVEELQGLLIGTKANILDFQERLNLENQNRQVIEQELKGREEAQPIKKKTEVSKELDRIENSLNKAEELHKEIKKTK